MTAVISSLVVLIGSRWHPVPMTITMTRLTTVTRIIETKATSTMKTTFSFPSPKTWPPTTGSSAAALFRVQRSSPAANQDIAQHQERRQIRDSSVSSRLDQLCRESPRNRWMVQHAMTARPRTFMFQGPTRFIRPGV
jgi:hypothetical protein